MCAWDGENHITSERWNWTFEEERIIISVLDRRESHQMWQCQTLAFLITTVSLETNGNHVQRSLIPEPSPESGETVGRCVRRKMIQYDNHAIRKGCRRRLTPGQYVLSRLIAYNQRIRALSLQYSAVTSSLHTGSDNLISGLLLEINSHNVCWLYCWKLNDDTLLPHKTPYSAKPKNLQTRLRSLKF